MTRTRIRMGRSAPALIATIAAMGFAAASASAATVTLSNASGPGVVRLPGTDPGGIPRWQVPFNSDVHLTGKVTDDSGAPAQQGVGGASFQSPFGQRPSGSSSWSTNADGTFTDSATIQIGTQVSAGIAAQPGFNIAGEATSNIFHFYPLAHVHLIGGTNFVTRIFYGQVDTLDGRKGKVYLQRKSGHAWRSVKTTHADGQGNYTIHYPRAPHGTYRAWFHSSSLLISLDNYSNSVRI